MKRKLGLCDALLFSGVLSISANIAIAESYLCLGQDSTGFRHAGRWEQSRFTVDEDKFIVRRVKPGEKDVLGKPVMAPYIIQKFGTNFLDAEMNACHFNQKGNLLFCNYFGSDVIVNPSRRLFQMIAKFGYVLQDDKDFSGDVSITIGKCSAID